VVLNCWVTGTNDTPLGIEDLDDLGEVGQRAGEPVDLVDHDNIGLALTDVGEQLLQCRPLHIAAGAPAIVIALRQAGPALMALAFDESFAGLALGVQRVELLLQSFLGRFASVDRTAQAVPARRAAALIHRRPCEMLGMAGA
jgi:hypothetical protein